MVSIEEFRNIALSFQETTEAPHFDKAAFRVGKKIFATLDEKAARASLKLSPIDQEVFGLHDKSVIYPVPNKWGKQGWTLVELNQVREDMLRDALTSAYREVAPKKLGDLYKVE
ncbi:MmcQ/YjbR family DNA-binding protein [Dyadobacter luticola]|uniref:MmcQ/YjbR family DNA-binding protein n=1 Tax=Dyadobacter luticola TaxID=1979387 RepID=A0A5R9L4D2_9BACT|nr:MmcQ/YjbR family DNA-binding protein [Dyadobacter luticola]TLV03237.1 MmcQ/YjbR family DNA-binding protein [Dyadobacter luticola]